MKPRVFIASILFSVAAHAGTIQLAWDPVTDADLVGYRVYYGTTASYGQTQDVGLITTATFTATDCTNYFAAVKARDAAGNLSTGFSNVIQGWPRPVVTGISPATIGTFAAPVTVLVTGSNFRTGASLQLGNQGVSVNSVVVNSCTQITAIVTAAVGAAGGSMSLAARNPDLTGSLPVNLMTIMSPSPPATPANLRRTDR